MNISVAETKLVTRNHKKNKTKFTCRRNGLIICVVHLEMWRITYDFSQLYVLLLTTPFFTLLLRLLPLHFPLPSPPLSSFLYSPHFFFFCLPFSLSSSFHLLSNKYCNRYFSVIRNADTICDSQKKNLF